VSVAVVSLMMILMAMAVRIVSTTVPMISTNSNLKTVVVVLLRLIRTVIARRTAKKIVILMLPS